MSWNGPAPRPVVVIMLDAAPAQALARLDSGWVRGSLRLQEFDVISAPAFADNRVLQGALRRTKEAGGRLHLIGLVSDGGAHSCLEHLFALIEAAARAGVRVVIHALLDGVDVPAGSAASYISRLERELDGGVGRIGTVSGRTWGMAPEGRWDRVEKVYRAITADNVDRADSALRGIERACQFGVPEQFAAPFVVFDYPGVSLVDTALHFNFAPEGARDLAQALAAPSFQRFSRPGGRAAFAGRFTCMTPYDSSLGLPTLFSRALDPDELALDRLVAAGHAVFECSRGSAPELAKTAVDAIRSGRYACVLADLSNPANAARSGAEALLGAVAPIVEATRDAGGDAIILGGRDATDRVPLVYATSASRGASIRTDARAADLAPTLLQRMRVSQPADMDGESVLLG